MSKGNLKQCHSYDIIVMFRHIQISFSFTQESGMVFLERLHSESGLEKFPLPWRLGQLGPSTVKIIA